MLRETGVLEGFPGLSERGDEGTVEDRRELVLWCPSVGRVEAIRYKTLEIILSASMICSLVLVAVPPSQWSL